MSVTTTKILTKPKAHRAREIIARPVLLLTISNGAAHTQSAEAIAEALGKQGLSSKVVDVSGYMSALGRFTHVTAYLWLVKNAPAIWEKIDAYQKKQTQTSPAWFYRRECQRLFDLAREIEPCAIVATEVGCGEIAALIKKDLNLNVPLVAVNLDYDADRAWLQPEVDLYSVAADFVKTDLIKLGADPEKIKVLGVPLKPRFKLLNQVERAQNRADICRRLRFNQALPIVLVAGGGEGLGKIEPIVKRLSKLNTQIIVLCGNNRKLKNVLTKLAENHQNLRVLGWQNNIAAFYQAANVLVSKLGLTFFEAMACGLPIVSLPPPPGAERMQYNLLEKFGAGRAVKTLDEMALAVGELSTDEPTFVKILRDVEQTGQTGAAMPIADWIAERVFI